MGDWRRNRSDSYNNYNHNYQSVPKSFARSQYRKPPVPDSWQTDRHSWQPALPSWQTSVPPWEKSFVNDVCKMQWKRFMYCQKGLDLYPDVYQWDDSAGADAFHNAKSRYWAEINGCPFDNSLPDPDMHIDQIDWNAEIDPELYQDLENAFVTPDEEVNDVETGFVVNSLYCNDQPIVPSGWGDEDDKNASNNDNPWVSQGGCWDDVPWGLRSLLKPVITFGCGDGEDDPSKAANNTVCNPSLQDGDKKTSTDNNPWEKNSGGWEGVPWGSRSQLNNTTNESGNLNCSRNNNNPWEGISGGWEGVPSSQENWNYSKKTSNNNYPWVGRAGGWEGVAWGPSSQVNNTTNELENLNYSGNGGSWKGGNDNWRKRESEGQQMSRYKTTRYHGEDHQRNQGWKNNRGRRRVSFARENSPLEPLAPRQWNPIHTCGPTTHHRPDNPENSWGWDKQPILQYVGTVGGAGSAEAVQDLIYLVHL